MSKYSLKATRGIKINLGAFPLNVSSSLVVFRLSSKNNTPNSQSALAGGEQQSFSYWTGVQISQRAPETLQGRDSPSEPKRTRQEPQNQATSSHSRKLNETSGASSKLGLGNPLHSQCPVSPSHRLRTLSGSTRSQTYRQ